MSDAPICASSADGWYYVHENDSNSSDRVIFHRVAVWSTDSEGRTVGMISVLGQGANGTENRLVSPPPLLEWMWGYGGMAMPKREALRSWWTTYSQQLQAGSRYIMGMVLGANEETFEIMQNGTHTQRKILESLAVRAI